MDHPYFRPGHLYSGTRSLIYPLSRWTPNEGSRVPIPRSLSGGSCIERRRSVNPPFRSHTPLPTSLGAPTQAVRLRGGKLSENKPGCRLPGQTAGYSPCTQGRVPPIATAYIHTRTGTWV